MPTFSDPIVLSSDGGTALFTYSFMHAKQVGKSYVQTSRDLAQTVNNQQSELVSKYDESHPSLNRGVIQVKFPLAINDGSFKPATFNISSVTHKEHDKDSLERVLTILLDSMTETGVKGRFINRV